MIILFFREIIMPIEKFIQDNRDYIKDLLLEVEAKYKEHNDYEESLEWDIKPAKEDVTNTYHLRRIGYHLCTVFNDNDLAYEVFDVATIEAAYDESGDLKDDKDDLIDVLNDMTFLDEDMAKSRADDFDLEI
tara:strand:+ start:325 stop:720 length:396 start_codon:yes stop_codon:yes gene_type:complete